VNPIRNLPTLLMLASLLQGAVTAAGPDRAPDAVSFRRDIVAVLSKAGCNAGPCHGNANGKGGFKLSLRGEDPDLDFTAMVLELGGRRVQPLEPESSLLLLKATATVAHEGGARFAKDSGGYRRLRDWIGAGAVDDGPSVALPTRLEILPAEIFADAAEPHVDLRATAVFADGTRRDVTSEAVYESSDPRVTVAADGRVPRVEGVETVVLARYLGAQTPVRIAFVPQSPGYAWNGPKPAGEIDSRVFGKLRRLRLDVSPLCSDEVFLRRVHLDLLGSLPTAREARDFVADRSRDKRARKVDELMGRPGFADLMALRWSDLLRVEERTLDRKGMVVFHRWIRESFRTNKPLDVFVREIVSARGSTYENPPANFHRAARTPVERSVAAAQVFLGTRLTCAQCHNHPFDRWTQDDYHDWAAAFAQVGYKVLRNDRRDENDSHEFDGEQVVHTASRDTVTNPRTGRPSVPRRLGGGVSAGPTDLDSLARWMTSADNRTFARVQANRIWAQMMGRGLVDPVDDFRATNPATHPGLLEWLADDFSGHGFDVRHLVRRILASRTYQLDSTPVGNNGTDVLNHSHAVLRRLGGEVLLDAQHDVLGVPFSAAGWPDGTRAVTLPGGAQIRENRKSDSDRFLEVFGKPPRVLTCECERSEAVTLGQTLQLISGPVVNRLLATSDNRLARLAASGRPNRELVEELYWTALTREPSAVEVAECESLLAGSGLRPGLEDIAWGLLNSKEFVLRR
jgi:mono/diheme cytochrome c family protein